MHGPMSVHPRPVPSAEGPEVHQIKRRFLAVNHDRLARVRQSLRPRQLAFLELLPLLFHINHPLLPGYISRATPAGLAAYQPSRASLEAARRMARSFAYERRALRQPLIEALFLMGSSGTVAQSEASDFDIWVCHHPQLSAPERAALRDKAIALTAWAAQLELEVHFFVMDAEGFRRGEHEALSHESSGSSQHHLLLEEFYRTGLLLAGRYPLWWLVPPDEEPRYEAYAAELLHKRFVKETEVIDLGPVRVPPGEFLGAALWQLYKGIDSPYKSVLKLLLMEAYASEYPSMDLLSTRFKRAVYAGDAALDRLDPYVMMAEKVEEYLSRRNEPERLELARRCLYLKVDEPLSRPPPVLQAPWRRELLGRLVQRWGWHHVQLLTLDSHASWKIDRVLHERRLLVDELTRGYRMLSAFAREHSRETPIDPGDLNRLGRKLYAAFERKAGKVELINPGISADLSEAQLAIQQSTSWDGEVNWSLIRGEPQETPGESPLKRTTSLIELVAWAHFNGLIGPTTLVNLHTSQSDLSMRELRAILGDLQQLFSRSGTGEAGMDELTRPAHLLVSALFINVGVDPLSHLTRHGMHVVTVHNDALRFGARFENLATSLDQIVATSWQEILTLRYTGPDALIDCLCAHLSWTRPGSGSPPPPVQARSYSSPRGEAIARRVNVLFDDVTRCFHDHPDAEAARYLLEVEDRHYVLQVRDEAVQHRCAASAGELLQLLGEPQRVFSPVLVDRFALVESPLRAVFAANRPGVVQLFYYIAGARAEVYVVDEKGSLFHQSASVRDSATLLAQFQRFFDTVLPRRDFLLADPPDVPYHEAVEYYQLSRDAHGWQALRRQPMHYGQGARYFDVQVIGDPSGGPGVTVYCRDHEFASRELGEGLFPAVARHVLAQRASGERYPIYVTDVEVTRPLLDGTAQAEVQTVDFLRLKKRIEDYLNREI
jgi:adenylate cyclase, class 1